jgi:hypothetical protein
MMNLIFMKTGIFWHYKEEDSQIQAKLWNTAKMGRVNLHFWLNHQRWISLKKSLISKSLKNRLKEDRKGFNQVQARIDKNTMKNIKWTLVFTAKNSINSINMGKRLNSKNSRKQMVLYNSTFQTWNLKVLKKGLNLMFLLQWLMLIQKVFELIMHKKSFLNLKICQIILDNMKKEY